MILAVSQSSVVFSRQNIAEDGFGESREVAVSKKSALQIFRMRLQQVHAAAWAG